MEPTIRLQKFIAQAGLASRRAAEQLITAGLVSVNGRIITKLGTTVDPKTDIVTVHGRQIFLPTKKIYLAVNKPAGLPSTAETKLGQSVATIVKTNQRLYQLDQLDKAASGLMVLTNDPAFVDQFKKQSGGLITEYFLVLDQDLEPSNIQLLKQGVRINRKKLAGITVVNAANKSAHVRMTGGTSHQIRKMFGQLGYTIRKLKRVRLGKLELKTLAEGKSQIIKPIDVI